MTLEPLVHQAIQQGAAVVTEGGAGVGVSAELVQPGLAASALLSGGQQFNSSRNKKYAFNGGCLWLCS